MKNYITLLMFGMLFLLTDKISAQAQVQRIKLTPLNEPITGNWITIIEEIDNSDGSSVMKYVLGAALNPTQITQTLINIGVNPLDRIQNCDCGYWKNVASTAGGGSKVSCGPSATVYDPVTHAPIYLCGNTNNTLCKAKIVDSASGGTMPVVTCE